MAIMDMALQANLDLTVYDLTIFRVIFYMMHYNEFLI